MPLQPAIVGTARVGNFRVGYVPATLALHRTTRVRILLAGIDGHVRDEGASIQDNLNDAPNTASFTVDTTAPTVGQPVRITINSDAPRLLFNGKVQTVAVSYELLKANWVWAVTAIDDLARLNQRLPFGAWTDVSATTVALQLIAAFAPGFTGASVQAGLPPVTLVLDRSGTFAGALQQLATLIGGYFYVEDLDVHLFLAEATDLPDPLDGAHRFLDDPPMNLTRDLSQVRTRVYGRGHGEAVSGPVPAGSTTIPLADVALFTPVPGGGQAVAGSEVFSYTGISLGGGATQVGPAFALTVAPSTALAPGTGIESGVHSYAYTWVTPTGETTASPLRTITVGTPAAPTVAPTTMHGSNVVSSGYAIGNALVYAYSYSTAVAQDDFTQETALSPSSVAITAIRAEHDAPGSTRVAGPFILIPSGGSADPRVRWIHVWKQINGGAWDLVVGNQTVAPSVGLTNGRTFTVDSGPGAVAPPTAAVLNKVTLTDVAVGPSPTTARKIYRTTAGGAQLKLQQTIANNTSTIGVLDATPDASLGANAPAADTSALSNEVEPGQGFYTSGVAFPTDGDATTATSVPVFTAGAYTFVAADVGASIVILSGTNWQPGSYLITGLSAGSAVLAAPCASVASPTSATWGIDYSALPSARLTWTDLVINASDARKITSAAQPLSFNVLGNAIAISEGVGFIAQRVVAIAKVGATITCDKAVGTVSATGGKGSITGAPASTVVLAGSTALVLASVTPFAAGGGWVLLDGGQVVRYTGITGSTLTGIPATGVGAITATVSFGSPVQALPMLTGVTGLDLPIAAGVSVQLWIQRDDVAAQAVMAALDGGDGIYEYLVTDDTRGLDALRALCDANLALFGPPLQTLTYATRDVKTKSGKPVVASLVSPPISASLTIQSVAITEMNHAAGVPPRFSVTASSVRFSLEDLLRRLTP